MQVSRGVRRVAVVLSCVLSAVLALALLDFAQQAWLVGPPLLVVIGLASLPLRLGRRGDRVGRCQRALLVAPAVLLLPHLPLAALDLPKDLGVSRAALIAVPAVAAALLAVRAVFLPAGPLLAARLTGAVVLSGILGLTLLTYYDVAPASGDAVAVEFPLTGQWLAGQAGRSLLTNHHTLGGDQGYAVDLVRRLPGGTTRSGPKGDLEAYAAFGEPVLSPVAGTVVRAVTDLPDQPIGGSDRVNRTGNSVVLRLASGEFVLLAHLRQGSVRLRPGQAVEAGALIGQVGNSGNTSEPHLHLQAMTAVEGGQALRLRFQDVQLTRNGSTTSRDSVELRRNDRIAARGSAQQARYTP